MYTITNFFKLSWLDYCHVPEFAGQNSLGFKIKLSKSTPYYYIKFSKSPNGFKVKSHSELTKICLNKSDLILKYLDICYLSKSILIQDNEYNVITINPYIEIRPIGSFLNFSDKKKMYFIYRLLKGFHHLHYQGILHGDINLQNIGVRYYYGQEIPIIFDLNLYEIDSAPKGALFCSPEFMSPELFRKNSYNIESELWAIGVLIYTITKFEIPFGSRIYGQSIDDIKNNITMNKIEECIHKSNLKLRPLLRNLLEIDPSKRITIKECMRIFKGEFDFIDKILLN